MTNDLAWRWILITLKRRVELRKEAVMRKQVRCTCLFEKTERNLFSNSDNFTHWEW